MKIEDFKEIVLSPWQVYYMMKTADGEICIEPLFGGHFHVAKYDSNQDLIGEKVRTPSLSQAMEIAEEMIK